MVSVPIRTAKGRHTHDRETIFTFFHITDLPRPGVSKLVSMPTGLLDQTPYGLAYLERTIHWLGQDPPRIFSTTKGCKGTKGCGCVCLERKAYILWSL